MASIGVEIPKQKKWPLFQIIDIRITMSHITHTPYTSNLWWFCYKNNDTKVEPEKGIPLIFGMKGFMPESFVKSNHTYLVS